MTEQVSDPWFVAGSDQLWPAHWAMIDQRAMMVGFGPEVRVTDELIADPPRSLITGQDLVTVSEAAPGGRSRVVFTDDYGGRATYLLTDYDPEAHTFGLKSVGR